MAEVRPSTDHDDGADESATVDGRRLRRERNVAAVIDAVLAMFVDESLTPTIERAAERSGLSLRPGVARPGGHGRDVASRSSRCALVGDR
jgi:hypothetical protein